MKKNLLKLLASLCACAMLVIGVTAQEEVASNPPVTCQFNEAGEPINFPCIYPISPMNHVQMPD